jgi:transposase InsO family protein
MSEGPARVEGTSPARAGEAARELIRRTRQVTRRKFPAQQKIRILQEGIHPTIYYEWLKDFMDHVPVADRTRLLSDRGLGYRARAFEDYRRILAIRHTYCSPYHPQTNGKLERFHEALKARLNLLVFTCPEALRAAMAEFIEFYNYRRYHEGIGNVTPADVYFGRREEILKRRKEQEQATLDRRFQYNLGPASDQIQSGLGGGLY